MSSREVLNDLYIRCLNSEVLVDRLPLPGVPFAKVVQNTIQLVFNCKGVHSLSDCRKLEWGFSMLDFRQFFVSQSSVEEPPTDQSTGAVISYIGTRVFLKLSNVDISYQTIFIDY